MNGGGYRNIPPFTYKILFILCDTLWAFVTLTSMDETDSSENWITKNTYMKVNCNASFTTRELKISL